ncbi:MAG: hypothetical protein JWQ71_1979 [Pedosphaera sp.]|nr:hypothetical protein [Pedosphaera sp.]
MRKHWFRFLKSTWGIFIEVTAEVDLQSIAPANAWRASRRVFVQNTVLNKLLPEEVNYLFCGVQSIAHEIESRTNPDKFVILRITDLMFAVTDYQPEGLYCAIREWAGEEFGFKPSAIPIDFNQSANQYIFTIPDPEAK